MALRTTNEMEPPTEPRPEGAVSRQSSTEAAVRHWGVPR